MTSSTSPATVVSLPLLGGKPAQPEASGTFRKAVEVLHSTPVSQISLLHRKLINALLKNALNPENVPDDEGYWTIGIGKLAKEVKFDSRNYAYIRQSAEELMRIVFEWDRLAPEKSRVKWKGSVLVPEVEIEDAVLRYQISSQMMKKLLNPTVYAVIDMEVVRLFTRASAMALWETCVRFENLRATGEMPWELVREIMVGKECPETYKDYRYFNKQVLTPAIKEINSISKHLIEVEVKKEGRKISTLRFHITRKAGAPQVPLPIIDLEIIGKLTQLRFSQGEARRIAASNDLEKIKAAIAYTEKRVADPTRKKIEKPAAYFRQALSGQYGVVEEQSGKKPSPARKAVKTFDLKGSFAHQREIEAVRHFKDLSSEDQSSIVERYNVAQAVPNLRLKKRITKAAEAAFGRWFAKELWGEPSDRELLEFAQKLLSQQPSSDPALA